MKNKYFLTVLSAIATALPFTFQNLSLVSIVAPSLFIFLLFTSDSKTVKRLSFLWSIVYYLGVHYYFVALYPLDFAGLSNLASIGVVLIGWLGISAFQGAELAIFIILYKKLFNTINLLSPIIFASFFALCEWVQSLGWLGFPWGQLSLTQFSFLPFIQSLSLFGPYFLTFLIVTINGYLALFYMSKKPLTLALAMLLFSSNTLFGLIRIQQPSEYTETLKAAIVQPSIMSGEKWDFSKAKNDFDLHMNMSREAEDANIVIWSETAIPSELLDNYGRMREIYGMLSKNNTALLCGTIINENGGIYNAAVYIDSDTTSSYYKQHLVPFGEYVPERRLIEALLPFLTDINMLSSDLSSGDESKPLETRWGKISALVCFDSIFTRLARQSVKNGGKLIVIITNDSWYKDSIALTHHNAQAVFRAVENGRYTVRCANSGISSYIDLNGRILEQTEPLEVVTLTREVGLTENKTLYTLIGNIYTPCSIIFLACCFVIYKKKSPR